MTSAGITGFSESVLWREQLCQGRHCEGKTGLMQDLSRLACNKELAVGPQPALRSGTHTGGREPQMLRVLMAAGLTTRVAFPSGSRSRIRSSLALREPDSILS